MNERIRDYQPPDCDAVVALSLRAWAPVFASMEEVVGPEIFIRLHGDWRQYQAKAVREVLADDATHVWVAEAEQVSPGRTAAGRALGGPAAAGPAAGGPAAAGPAVAGFAAATVFDPQRRLGEIVMLAVDPASQRHGLGTALTEFATGWLRDAGMRVAMIGTGGDPGHAPARRVYEKADYTLIPMARYFKAL